MFALVRYQVGTIMAQPLMTVEDVSRYLNVPVNTIYAWRSRGQGPKASKVGRHLRFRRSDIDSWLTEHET